MLANKTIDWKKHCRLLLEDVAQYLNIPLEKVYSNAQEWSGKQVYELWDRVVGNSQEQDKLISFYQAHNENNICANALDNVRRFVHLCPKGLLDSDEKEKIGDYGCGVALYSFVLAMEKKCEVWLLDISESMKDFLCWRINKYQLNARLINYGSDLPNDFFDKIVCFDVLEHVPSPKKILQDITRSLRKGGRLFLFVQQTPGRWHLWHAIKEYRTIGLSYLKKSIVIPQAQTI